MVPGPVLLSRRCGTPALGALGLRASVVLDGYGGLGQLFLESALSAVHGEQGEGERKHSMYMCRYMWVRVCM